MRGSVTCAYILFAFWSQHVESITYLSIVAQTAPSMPCSVGLHLDSLVDFQRYCVTHPSVAATLKKYKYPTVQLLCNNLQTMRQTRYRRLERIQYWPQHY